MAELYLQGRVLGKFQITPTAKGGQVAKGLLEVEYIRKSGRDHYGPETHVLPITSFGWQATQLAELPDGTLVTLGCRLNGNRYDPPGGGEPKHYLQLIVETVALVPTFRPAHPLRELNS